jgi:hypothetical protein
MSSLKNLNSFGHFLVTLLLDTRKIQAIARLFYLAIKKIYHDWNHRYLVSNYS